MSAETNGKRNDNALWGIGLVALGALLLVARFSPWINGLIWMGALAVGGAVFYGMYRSQEDRRWALIPAYTLWAIAGVIGLSLLEDLGLIDGLLIGSYVLFAIAAPFLYLYLRDKKRWWALIPAGLLGLTAMGLLIGATVHMVPVVLIALGVYLLARHFWGKARAAAKPLTGPEADKAPS
jgi:hypothetical protein